MKIVPCPHCGHKRIVTSIFPRDMVVVLPCPACRQLVVLFRKTAVGLNRDIIESGSFEQRKGHIADVIAKFLEAGILPIGEELEDDLEPPHGFGRDDNRDYNDEPAFDDEVKHMKPITEREVERFVRLELDRIDDAAYFKKYFG